MQVADRRDDAEAIEPAAQRERREARVSAMRQLNFRDVRLPPDLVPAGPRE